MPEIQEEMENYNKVNNVKSFPTEIENTTTNKTFDLSKKSSYKKYLNFRKVSVN